MTAAVTEQPSLTPPQIQILRFIQSYWREHLCAPTLQEIGDSRGVNRVTAIEHTQKLIDAGMLQKIAGKTRTLQLTAAADERIGKALCRETADAIKSLAEQRGVWSVEMGEVYERLGIG